MKYLLLENSMLPPPICIDAIETKWEHDDVFHMDHFFEFLCCRRMPYVPEDRIPFLFVDPTYVILLSLCDACFWVGHSIRVTFVVFWHCDVLFDSSSKDTDVASPTLMSLHSVFLETWVPPGLNMVDPVSKDEGEDIKEDTSYKEDLSMDEEHPAMEPKIMEEDSSQDSSKESY